MSYWLFAIFVLLHGLVFLIYPAMAQGWMPLPEGTDFTGRSWLLGNVLGEPGTRTLGTYLFTTVVLIFLIAFVGLAFRQDWSTGWLYGALILSSLGLVVMWDGHPARLPDQGLIGLLINSGLAVLMIYFGFPKF
jgi:hypothetical protein